MIVSLRWYSLCSLLFACLAATAVGKPQSGENAAPATTSAREPQPVATGAAQVELAEANPESADDPEAADQRPSEAERIARLNRRLDTDRQQLADLRAKINDPQSDYVLAEKEFEKLDIELAALQETYDTLRKTGKAIDAARLRPDVDEMIKKWRLAEERFNLEIAERKAVLGQIASLEQKLEKDQEALDKLRGVETPKESEDARPLPSVDPEKPTRRQNDGETAMEGDDSGDAKEKEDAAEPRSDADEPSKEEIEASEELKAKEAVAAEAEQEVRSIIDRIAIVTDNVAVARTLLETARKQADNADATAKALDEEFFEALAAGTPQDQLEALRAKLEEAQDRVAVARAEARQHGNRLDELQTELATLQTEQIEALQLAESSRDAADEAREKLDALQNPFALHNVAQWLLEHGPKIFCILMAMAGFVWISRLLEHRLVDLIAHRSTRGSAEDRENRAKTLVGVFHNAATLLIIAGGSLMIFDEMGIPVGPLMGGAAVVGLAVAFGAQSLIKDFFTGFMILLEQQFMVNDVVKIGDISGQVERISLRMTVLRDLEGRVHFIPHGQITSTTNLTHGWSRAVFDIGVAYKENVDRVMQVLLDICKDLRRDPSFGPLILEDAVMLGVDSLGDSAVIIKFYFKTRPLRQWPVKREMLRRIKTTFDELGIEIPFPHQTVYQHYAGSQSPGHRDDDEWPTKRIA